jgi:hypothetical protein
MMNCRDAQPLLDVMNDGALSAKDCALVLDHLKTCDDCQAEWSSMESLRSRFREIKNQPSIPRNLELEITQALKDEQKAASNLVLKKMFRPAFSVLAIAAAFIAIVFFQQFPISRNALPMIAGATVESILSEAETNTSLRTTARDKLAGQLGYELKYLPLNSWHLKECNIYKPHTGSAIAQFQFCNKEAPLEELTCYQAPEGTIHNNHQNPKVIGSKRVEFGTYGKYRFALWCQNGRDYLFVTSTPKLPLEQIVSEV